MKHMTYIIKKPDPLILNDYAEVGSAYSRTKSKFPYPAWKVYEDYRKEFLRLHAVVGKRIQQNGICDDWTWADYKEARENLLLAHQMIEEEIGGKPVMVKEREVVKFNAAEKAGKS